MASAGPGSDGRKKVAELPHLGLDQPLIVQYGKFLSQCLKGDFGTSLFTKQPVITELMQRLPATVELALVSVLISSILGVLLGVFLRSGSIPCSTMPVRLAAL